MGYRVICVVLTWIVCGASLGWGANDALNHSKQLKKMEARGFQSIEDTVIRSGPSTLIHGGKVMTAAGDIFEKGFVLMEEGRVVSVGTTLPKYTKDTTVLEIPAHFTITPGLIDTHSHLGVYPSPRGKAHSDGNEATSPTTPGVWAEHSFWPQDPGLYRAIAGGVTTLQALPGSANLIGGRGVTLRVIPHRGSRAMRFPGAPETIKMACGENPKRVYGTHRDSAPSTRMGNLRGQRTAFLEAEHYLKEWKKSEKRGDKKGFPKRDLNMETLAGVLEGRILPQIHCYRADDMLSMMQLADEFGFKIRSFHHALESYKIRDILAEYEIASSTWADWWGFKLEAYDGIQENAAMITDAGARAIIHSDSAIGIQRLNQEASKAYYAGLHAGIDLTDDEVLKWITLHPAWALGIDEQVGTLEAGKRADVVVWNGDPFSVYTKAKWVFIDGTLHFDVDRPEVWSDFSLGQEAGQ